MAAGKPHIIAAQDPDAMAQIAAERLLERIGQARPRAAICLTGGSGPVRLYQLLATEPYRTRLPWERVHWFMGDDRFVPVDDELSNMGAARRIFLDRVQAPRESIHAMPTSAASPEIAAQLYAGELKGFYGRERLDPARPLFDLVLMGLGPDGHTASLFPGSPALNETRRWVLGIDKAGHEPFVPRVTLTFPALASTREMLFMVSGEDKRAVLGRVLAGEDLPAARAHADGELVWLVDRSAAPAGC